MTRLALLLVLLFASLPALAETLSGRAYGVDGDTLRVGGIAVRLKGVAAPEVKHPGYPVADPGGAAAQAFVRKMVDGRIAVCELTREVTWGRRVGVCSVGGKDVGEAVIAAGLARDCPRYGHGRYASVERPEAAQLPFPSYCQIRKPKAKPR